MQGTHLVPLREGEEEHGDFTSAHPLLWLRSATCSISRSPSPRMRQVTPLTGKEAKKCCSVCGQGRQGNQWSWTLVPSTSKASQGLYKSRQKEGRLEGAASSPHFAFCPKTHLRNQERRPQHWTAHLLRADSGRASSSLSHLQSYFPGGTGFPGGSDGKESACSAGEPGLVPGLGRPRREGNGNPLRYSHLNGQRSLVGYSPWGRKESDTTERLNTKAWMFWEVI